MGRTEIQKFMSEDIEKKQTPWQLLRNKFPEQEYVLMAEVSDASGFSRTRSLDYMLVNLWQSRGLAVTGIEQKSWRNDWLKELKNPKKQENHFKYCDYFYLLTTAENVAKIEEIPVTWGWYHIKGNRIITMKQAPSLTPAPIDRSLLCAMLRRAACKKQFVHVDSVQDEVQQKLSQALENRNYEGKRAYEDLKKLEKTLKDFQDASGIDIENGWHHYWRGDNSKRLGEIVKQIFTNGAQSEIDRLKRLKQDAEYITAELTKKLKVYEANNTQPVLGSGGQSLQDEES